MVAAPDGRAYVNPTGTPWLGTAGSGDVLCGLIGSLLAGGLEAPLAAAVGAYVHGVAGQIAAARRAAVVGRRAGRAPPGAERDPSRAGAPARLGGWARAAHRGRHRSRRDPRQRRDAARRHVRRAHGGRQGRRVRARVAALRAGRARGRRDVAGHGHRRRGAGAARRGHHRPVAVVALDAGRAGHRPAGPRGGHRPVGERPMAARRDRRGRPGRPAGPRGSTSRSTRACRATAATSTTGPISSPRRQGAGGAARSRSSACGATSPTPTRPATRRSRGRSRRSTTAVAVAARAGVEPQIRHLANSAATLTLPDAHFDLVRPGIAVYGLPPVPGGSFGLTPAMTLRCRGRRQARARRRRRLLRARVRDRRATHARARAARLRRRGAAARRPTSGRCPSAARRFTVSGRVCMDQFVVDVGDLPVQPGDPVVLFGAGHATASRPRRTGPRSPAPSTTRS